MEELALKPDAAIPTNINYAQLEQNSVIRSVLTYNYGEDVSKWGVILPFTVNQTQTNNLLAMFDGQGDTYYQLSGNGDANAKQTQFIIDFGKQLEIRGTILSYRMYYPDGDAARTHTITFDYTLNGIDWINIDSHSQVGLTAVAFFGDFVANLSRIRGLRVTYNTPGGGAASNPDARFYQLMVIV